MTNISKPHRNLEHYSLTCIHSAKRVPCKEIKCF